MVFACFFHYSTFENIIWKIELATPLLNANVFLFMFLQSFFYLIAVSFCHLFSEPNQHHLKHAFHTSRAKNKLQVNNLTVDTVNPQRF